MMPDLNLLRETLTVIQRIYESDLAWVFKYDMIFTLCAKKLWGNLPGFSYCDPDSSYQEDVEAVYQALQQYLEEQEKIEAKTS
jgi:hypothetical protein